jgi:hypothetical protein
MFLPFLGQPRCLEFRNRTVSSLWKFISAASGASSSASGSGRICLTAGSWNGDHGFASGLFNAFTAACRGINPHTALRRREALHGLFGAVVGLS